MYFMRQINLKRKKKCERSFFLVCPFVSNNIIHCFQRNGMVTQQTRPSIVAAEVYRKEIEVNLSESSIMMYCFEANTNVDQKLCRV